MERKTIIMCPHCRVTVVPGGYRWYCDASHPEWFDQSSEREELQQQYQEARAALQAAERDRALSLDDYQERLHELRELHKAIRLMEKTPYTQL